MPDTSSPTATRGQTRSEEYFDYAIIGSGFAGLGMAIELKKKGRDNFVILERADDVGGTWRDNSYPGAACDVALTCIHFPLNPIAIGRGFIPVSRS